MSVITQAMGVSFVILLVGLILLASNWISDRFDAPVLSRRVAGALGGFVFLLVILTLEVAVAVSLSVLIAAAIALIQPYWASCAGALAAVGVERFRLIRHYVWEDNWVIVASALGVMILLR